MITTDRLVLRRARPTDLEAFHAIFSDPRAMRYWDRPAYTDIRDSLRFVRALMSDHPDNLDFAVEFDGRCIGKAGMWKLAEVGYILHPDYWRRGFATEALSAVLTHIQATRADIESITAELDPRNTASMRLLQKLGFTQTHLEKQNFDYGGLEMCDTAYYRLHLRTQSGLF